MSLHEVSYIRCDRCGRQEEGIDSPDNWATFIECYIPGLKVSGDPYELHSLDICNQCTPGFIEWMTGYGMLENRISEMQKNVIEYRKCMGEAEAAKSSQEILDRVRE